MKRFRLPEKLSPVATVLKTYGADGEIAVKLYGYDLEEIDTKEPVFINIDGLPVPFLISSARKKGETQAIIKLDPISRKAAEEICGLEILSEQFTEESGDMHFGDVAGLQIMNQHGKILGTAVEFIDIPGNPCIEVKLADTGEDILIPAADDLILDIDENKGLLKMNVPDGLF